MRFRLIIAFAWTMAVFIGLLVLPTYSNGSTLLAVNAARALVAIGIPVLISSIPLFLSHKTRIPVGAAMLVFVLIGGMSIGLFYTPSAAILLWPYRGGAGPNN